MGVQVIPIPTEVVSHSNSQFCFIPIPMGFPVPLGIPFPCTSLVTMLVLSVLYSRRLRAQTCPSRMRDFFLRSTDRCPLLTLALTWREPNPGLPCEEVRRLNHCAATAAAASVAKLQQLHFVSLCVFMCFVGVRLCVYVRVRHFFTAFFLAQSFNDFKVFSSHLLELLFCVTVFFGLFTRQFCSV